MRTGEIEGWPYATYPTGWFQVAWSPEVAAGEIVSARYWDRDLIIWRGESGTAHVSQAHETRRGLHLGCGEIVGESVRNRLDGCRWHPNGTGTTVAGEHITGPGALRTFPTAERLGFVLAWYDAARGEPTWPAEDIIEHDCSTMYPAWPHGTTLDPMNTQVQMFAENIADAVHVEYAHRWTEANILSWEEIGPLLRVNYAGRFPSKKGTVEAVFENDAWGLGVLKTEMTSLRHFVHFVCPTPVSRSQVDIRLSAWVQCASGDTGEKPDGTAKAVIRAQHHEVLGPDVDRPIWENQAYLPHAGFRKREREYVSFRRWAARFYPHEAAVESSSQPVAAI
jgi:hypothetical protein